MFVVSGFGVAFDACSYLPFNLISRVVLFNILLDFMTCTLEFPYFQVLIYPCFVSLLYLLHFSLLND